MEFTPAGRSWPSPPLALQIMGLLLGGLVVAQLVTLVLTLLFPPAPAQQYNLDDIAHALKGDDVTTNTSKLLQRVVQANPPELVGPGWLTSENARHELAMLLARRDDEVQLFFFTPLPFAGTERGMPKGASTGSSRESVSAFDDGRGQGGGRVVYASFLLAQAARPGAPAGGPRSSAPGGPSGQQGRGSGLTPGPDGFNFGPNNNPGSATTAPGSSTSPWTFTSPSNPQGSTLNPATSNTPSLQQRSAGTPSSFDGRDRIGTSTNGSPPPATNADPSDVAPSQARPGMAPGGALTGPRSSVPVTTGTGLHAAPLSDSIGTRTAFPDLRTPTVTKDAPVDRSSIDTSKSKGVATVREKAVKSGDGNASSSDSTTRASTPTRSTATMVKAAPIAVAAAPRGLFGLAPSPFVEGDFVAAMRIGDGWAVVQPIPAPFPNSWQRRVLLWFAIAFAVIAPVGWLFARRLVRPITGFAIAAEQLGRDPSASVLAISGPAEIGRAAHAFNRMQSRLRSFVDDRTAMIGAISHDLRTPLTRLRFRIEDVEDEFRAGMLHEVEEMEAMITSVLAFIRDASEPGHREKLDLSSIVEDVVEDAVFVGKDVRLTLNEKAPVEVDAIGMRRLLSNLVENAVKYGDHARVRLFTDRHDAIAEVSDDGPGLSDQELERVFEPFYRAAAARSSDKEGSGLGLAVCRSIARAHGGDVQLSRGERGLIAQVRLPLAYPG
jgi:two-component system, OmpR family, sensor kinase